MMTHFFKPFVLSTTPRFLYLKPPTLPPYSLCRSHPSASAIIRAKAMRFSNLLPVQAAAENGAASSASATNDFDDSSLGNGYCLPPQEIRDIVDAPPLPTLSFSPHRDKLLFLKRRSLPPLADLAKPEEKLAGIRIDGKSNSRSRMSFYTGIGIHHIMDDGTLSPEREMHGLPSGAKLNFVTWQDTVRNGEFFLLSHRQTLCARGRGIQGKQVYSSSLPEGLPLVQKQDFMLLSKPKTLLCCLNKFRSYCSDSEFESDDHESELYVVDGKINVDGKEVDRVCKVMEETFAFDRNMETVLDECGVDLSHELVLRVLERFKHARKPAFRFFCWASERRGFAHDLNSYNVVLSILGKGRQFETMVSVLEEMGDKDLLTIQTFTICIKAFAAAKEGKKAVGILDLMKKFKFKVDSEMINCLLDALGRAKLGKEAQVLFEKLEHRFTPNLCTYTVLLHGWCRVNNLMEAGRTWNEMIDNGFKPDIVAHNIMLEGLLRNKKRSHAMELFGVMKSRGPYPSVRSYTVLIEDLCKRGNMQEAMEYLDEMLESGCEPDAVLYTCLMTGFGNQKKMNMVYRLLKEMQEKGCPPDGRTYNALIKMMTSQHMPDAAAKIYKKMILSNIRPSIHTYNIMMKSYFTSRNYEMGCAVWEEMKKKGCCPDENSYIVLIRGLKRQGRSIEACRYTEEMIGKGMKAPQLDYKYASDISWADRPDSSEVLTQKMKFL